MADMMVAAMQYLPVGYRFHPTDEELLGHYLQMKNLGEEDPVCVIPEVNLYCWEPEELIRKFRESSIIQSKDPQWWFFCEKRPGPTQQRSTKGGYWKKTGLTRDVKSSDGTKEVIGSKKILTFFRGNSSSSKKTDWIMHEYDLKGSALNSFPLRKNYVLCMIKCNSDKTANSTPAYEGEWNIYDLQLEAETDSDEMADEATDYECEQNISDLLLEPEADDGFSPEHMFQARLQSLETLSRTPNHGGNINMLTPGLGIRINSADSSPWQYLSGGVSIESDSAFPSSELPIADAVELDSSLSASELLGRYSIRERDSSSSSSKCSGYLEDIVNRHFMRNGTQASEPFVRRRLELQAGWDHNVSETLRPREQPADIMESKQSQKPEPLYAFWPIDEKKGIVEDNSPRPTTSAQAEAPKVKIEEECIEMISEAQAQKHTPIKIEEISISDAGSSSTSIQKPRKPDTDATCTAKGEETNTVAALNDHEKPAQKLKLEATVTEQVSCSCSVKQLSSSNLPMVHAGNLLAGIILCVAICCENAMADLGDHENPAKELKLEAVETEPVSRSCSQSIKQCSSSSPSMVYARNLLVGILLCIVIFCDMFKALIF